MGIEGRLRDLGLIEVLQLIAVGRKSGTLYCEAPLLGLSGSIGFLQGTIVQADLRDVPPTRSSGPAHGHSASLSPGPAVASGLASVMTPLPASTADAESAGDVARDAVFRMLRWQDGSFRFAPSDVPDVASPLRLGVEPLLMEGALQAEVWSRIEARVPHAGVVPVFAEVEPQPLPLLRLTPPQWEILTGIDGHRDLSALAEAMGRELMDVAQLVHDLIEAGLLILRDTTPAPRRNPTPPVNLVVPPIRDLWVPEGEAADLLVVGVAGTGELDDEDQVFDPVHWGVITADGLPQRATPWPPLRVAPSPPEPSLDGTDSVDALGEQSLTLLRRLGDECVRRGDLSGAIAHWDRAVAATASEAAAGGDPDRLHERIALVRRLDDLLSQWHPETVQR